MVQFIIEETDEKIFGNAGLAMVGQLLNQTNVDARLNALPLPSQSRSCAISHGDVARSYIGLLCQGKSDFEHIESFQDQVEYAFPLDIDHIPSAATLRQRLNQAAVTDKWKAFLLEESAHLLHQYQTLLTPIVLKGNRQWLPLDIDVSPFDNSNTKKEGLGRTYQGFDGYAPIFAYLGREGFMVNVELRHGDTHCQKGTPNFLKETLKYARRITEKPLLVRMDAGNDSAENVNLYPDEGIDFIVKRNPRQESKEDWLAYAKKHGKADHQRQGKVVYRGSYWTKPNGYEKKVRLVYEVTERTIEADGQILLMPDIELNTYYTRIGDRPETIIALYQDHGTMEQFHSEYKTELDLERLPSGRFETNDLVMHIGLLAYNILRLIGQESLRKHDAPLRKKAQRRRLRTVIQDMVMMAVKLVFHARRWRLKVNRNNKWLPTFKRLYQAFSPT